MSAPACCAVEPAVAEGPNRCPECQRVGTGVDSITLKALLRSEGLAAMEAGGYRFCATPHCAVVYFGPGRSFGRDDLGVAVFQKEPAGDRIVCYCLSITEAELAGEAAASGRSASRDRILALVESGRCACELRNPQGRCCLGNVDAVVRNARAVQAAPLDPGDAGQQ